MQPHPASRASFIREGETEALLGKMMQPKGLFTWRAEQAQLNAIRQLPFRRACYLCIAFEFRAFSVSNLIQKKNLCFYFTRVIVAYAVME